MTGRKSDLVESSLIVCPNCRREARVPASMLGRALRCKNCGQLVGADVASEARPGQTAPSMTGFRSSARLAWVVGTVVVVAIASGFVVILKNQMGSSVASNTTGERTSSPLADPLSKADGAPTLIPPVEVRHDDATSLAESITPSTWPETSTSDEESDRVPETLPAVAESNVPPIPVEDPCGESTVEIDLAFKALTDGDVDRAHATFDRLAKSDPTSARVQCGLGGVHSLKYAEAAVRLEKAKRDLQAIETNYSLKRNNESEWLIKRFDANNKVIEASMAGLQSLADAVASFKEAVRLRMGCPMAHFGLGMAYRQMPQHEAAIREFEFAIAINPSDLVTLCVLAEEYLEIGNGRKALDAATAAVAIDKGNAKAHFVLGKVYFLTGKQAEAIAEYELLKSLDADVANDLFNFLYPGPSKSPK